MSRAVMLYLAGVAAFGNALTTFLPRAGRDTQPTRDTAAMTWLAGVTLALLVVGVVSGTLWRHVVQIAPLALAVALIASRSQYGAAAAAPLFVFWLGIMLNIWLYLLGLLRIFSGTFTPIEVALTVAIGLSCVGGLVAFSRRPTPLSHGARLAVSSLFSVLQIGALMASFAVGRH